MATLPYVKQTWTDGASALSAARMTVIENGIFDAGLNPAVRVHHNANQSITNATDTTLAFNTEAFDQAGGAADTQHDTVTNNSRLTCKYAGIYSIVGSVRWGSNSSGYRWLIVRLNGTTVIAQTLLPPVNGAVTIHNVTTTYSLAVNDYVELRCHQTSGGALNAETDVAGTFFSMSRVG